MNEIKALIQQCEKITEKDLSVEDLYLNLKYLRETVQAVKEEVFKSEITVTISGSVGTGKTALSYIISKALENADIEYTAPDLALEYNQTEREDIENADLSGIKVLMVEDVKK
jgi:pantothenate kinase-related protein Tda10